MRKTPYVDNASRRRAGIDHRLHRPQPVPFLFGVVCRVLVMGRVFAILFHPSPLVRLLRDVFGPLTRIRQNTECP